MNKNIEVINKNLIAVNFEFVNMKYIKEISFSDTKNSDYACLTNDGRILLNKSHSIYQNHLQLIKQIMMLDDEQLNEDKSFYKVIKIVLPAWKKYSDNQIEHMIQKYGLENAKRVFLNCCDLEKQRRIIKGEYSQSNKKNNSLDIFKRLLKGKGVKK